MPKNDGHAPAYEPSSAEIDAAMMHRKAIKSLFRHGNVERLDNLEKKSLTSFSCGTNSFILPPQMSNKVLNCLVDLTDGKGPMVNERRLKILCRRAYDKVVSFGYRQGDVLCPLEKHS